MNDLEQREKRERKEREKREKRERKERERECVSKKFLETYNFFIKKNLYFIC